MQVPARIWTIGHSTRPLAEFVAALSAHAIEAVADVRRFPGSRRHPHFGADSLEHELQRYDIAYGRFPDLGGRRTARADSRNTAWRNASFRGYADYMETAEYDRALARLGEFARRRCAVMCAESLWWRCHRALISDDFKRRGVEVLHVGGDGRSTEHPYTAAARIVGDRLSYDAAPPDLFNSH